MSLKKFIIHVSQGYLGELNCGCVSADIGPLSFFRPRKHYPTSVRINTSGKLIEKILGDVVKEIWWQVEVSQKASHDDVNRIFPTRHHKKLFGNQTKKKLYLTSFVNSPDWYLSRNLTWRNLVPRMIVFQSALWNFILPTPNGNLCCTVEEIWFFGVPRKMYHPGRLGYSCELNRGCVLAEIGLL